MFCFFYTPELQMCFWRRRANEANKNFTGIEGGGEEGEEDTSCSEARGERK